MATEPPYGRRAASRSAEQLAYARDDPAAVQLDVGEELLVGQAGHAVFQVEPGGAEGAEVRGDLLRDGLGCADVERPVLPGFGVERLLGGDREAALVGNVGDDVPPAWPELRLRLLVGGRDVAGECTPTGSGGRPNFSRARWNSSEYAANL